MTVEFDKSFLKSISKIKDTSILSKIKQTISEVENAKSLGELKNLKKLLGFKNYYRIRLGEYRIGFEKLNSTKVRLIIIAHRKDIYKNFP